jgi:hypothetical protein
VSLSTDPAFSILKNDFICGYKDISRARYAGASGKHQPDENAVDTTNGAGPHNIQMFIITPDGIVLHCLPGYWHSQDLADELRFAEQLNDVWNDQSLTREEKDRAFAQMQLRHIASHSPAERNRSRLQGFDVKFEAEHKLGRTDVFYNPSAIDPRGSIPPAQVKTADVIMHERMAVRPFEEYKRFDVAAYSDYGKNVYDKHEQFRDSTGQIAKGADLSSEPMIGNDPRAHPIETQVKKEGKRAARSGLNFLLRYGIRAALQ